MKELKRGQMQDYVFILFIQPLFNQVDPVEMENQHRQQQIAAKTIDKRHRQKPFYPVCKYIS